MHFYTLPELISKNNHTVYKYSQSSLKKLLQIDPQLVDLLFEAANHIDVKIVSGYRTAEEQNHLFKRGLSTKDGYLHKSTHQSHRAVDILPLPHDINMYQTSEENTRRWHYFTGFIQGLAASRGLPIRCGLKWRTKPMAVLERPLHDNTFIDANHFELIKG